MPHKILTWESSETTQLWWVSFQIDQGLEVRYIQEFWAFKEYWKQVYHIHDSFTTVLNNDFFFPDYRLKTFTGLKIRDFPLPTHLLLCNSK